MLKSMKNGDEDDDARTHTTNDYPPLSHHNKAVSLSAERQKFKKFKIFTQ